MRRTMIGAVAALATLVGAAPAAAKPAPEVLAEAVQMASSHWGVCLDAQGRSTAVADVLPDGALDAFAAEGVKGYEAIYDGKAAGVSYGGCHVAIVDALSDPNTVCRWAFHELGHEAGHGHGEGGIMGPDATWSAPFAPCDDRWPAPEQEAERDARAPMSDAVARSASRSMLAVLRTGTRGRIDVRCARAVAPRRTCWGRWRVHGRLTKWHAMTVRWSGVYDTRGRQIADAFRSPRLDGKTMKGTA